jgi:hypothetical protein
MEAPGESPLRHGDASRNLGVPKRFDLGQILFEACGLEGGAKVDSGEGRAGLVLSREQSTGERRPSQDAKVIAFGAWEKQIPSGRRSRRLYTTWSTSTPNWRASRA